MFSQILVAFDNSVHAHKSLKMGFEFAKKNNSHLHVVTVVHLPDYAGTIDEVDETMREKKNLYEEIMGKVVAEAEKQGIKITSKILYGHIGQTLIKYEKEHEIDIIITGSHGKSPAAKLLLGSVSSYILKHANCPVLIVRES